MILANELTHALRGEEGIKSIDTDGGINKDEEASTIEVENKIRTELGYAVRKDEDSSDGGDGNYGKYSDSSEEDCYNKIDEMQGSETVSGNAYAYVWNFTYGCPSSESVSESGENGSDDCDCDCIWGSSYDYSIWDSVSDYDWDCDSDCDWDCVSTWDLWNSFWDCHNDSEDKITVAVSKYSNQITTSSKMKTGWIQDEGGTV